ncbi:MAG: hypothetical protein QW578_02510 [Thermoplasmatales archaeon]
MITGYLEGRRVVIKDEKEASRLRNRGYKGKDIGTKLSLSLPVSYYLARSGRLEILSGMKKMGSEDLVTIMNGSERRIASAYAYLRADGKNPQVRGRGMWWNELPVRIYSENEIVDLSKFGKKSYLCVTSSEGCLLYLSELFLKKKGGMNLKEALEKKGYRVGDGLKYGCDYRVYEDLPHATFLITYDDRPIARDLVARVRIAHSVRKIYVHASYSKGQLVLYKFLWVR